MKIGKKKLNEIFKYTLSEIKKKKKKELSDAYKWRQEEYKRVKEIAKEKIVSIITHGEFKDVAPMVEKSWNGTGFSATVYLHKDQYLEIINLYKEIEDAYNRRVSEIEAKYAELLDKLHNWYDESYKKLVFGDVADIPGWLKELVGL